jgi:glycerol uptake facilitator protein
VESKFIAELIGTFLLILLGGGVCANVSLKKTAGHDSGWIVITAGWGLAVAMAVYAVVNVSGAHINPAVTLGLASIGEMNTQAGVLDTSRIATYLIGQFIGAILGATTVWLAYLPHWEATKDPADKLGVFSTAPAIRKPFANLLCEIIGTAVLVLGVLAIFSPDALTSDARKNLGDEETAEATRQIWAFGLKPLLVGLLVFAIGLSLGGPTGYAINPARDLGPRIAHALLPIAGKGGSDWSYAWIPVVGPCLGGVLGALVYKALWM